jgi:N-sulfoglucosamine sulfohydrolase
MAKHDLKDKPNVVLFISHDTGASVSCEGGPIDTPNLNRVAENGVCFTNHFSTAPQCTPSRGCLITGKYPHCNGLMGLTNYGWNLPEHYQTILKLLRSKNEALIQSARIVHGGRSILVAV